MNIPKPLPDEHVLGWRGRIKFLNHHPKVQDTNSELEIFYGERGEEHSVAGERTLPFLLLAKASGMPLCDFAQQHSLLPYIRAFIADIFQPENEEAFIRSRIQLYGMRTGKKGAWFCSKCIQDDLDNYGVPYWKRAHQLIGVDWCVHHGNKLLGLASKKAFDSLPPINVNSNEVIIPDGPMFLGNEDVVIKRFIDISKALLDRKKPMNYKKVGTMLRIKAVQQVSADSKRERVNLTQLAEKIFPDFWKIHFMEVKGENAGQKLTDFNKVFKHTRTASATKYYIVAFALLFESLEEAIQSFSESEGVTLNHVRPVMCYGGVKFWRGKKVFGSYIRSKGSHDIMSSELNISRRHLTMSLDAIGLPALGKVKSIEIRALAYFYAGEPLADACRKYGVEAKKLEKLIRKSGTQLGKALAKMVELNI